jgi:hypothetical protein
VTVLATLRTPGENMAGVGEAQAASPATSFVLQVRDAVAECHSNPDVGPWSRRAAVVAAGPAQIGERDRRRRRGRGPVSAGADHRERRPPPPGQRPSTPQQAPEAQRRGPAEASHRRTLVVVVASRDHHRPAGHEQLYRSDDTGQLESPWSSTECSCCGESHRK